MQLSKLPNSSNSNYRNKMLQKTSLLIRGGQLSSLQLSESCDQFVITLIHVVGLFGGMLFVTTPAQCFV